MQAFLVNLMAATLVIQSVFGCCRGGLPHVGNGKARSVASSHCCHCNHLSRESQQPTTPCNAQCRGVCAYVATSKIEVENPALIWQVYLAAVSSATTDTLNQGRAIFAGSSESDHLIPPARLHLLNQIWLI